MEYSSMCLALALAMVAVPTVAVTPCVAQCSARGLGIGPVSWDENVVAFAQSYAAQRQGDCRLVHSGGRPNGYRENLFWGGGSDWTASDAVGAWVGEKQDYDYNSNSCAAGKVCGHYTQVVWHKSTAIGCARVVCNNGGGVFITCNYSPPGNYVRERP